MSKSPHPFGSSGSPAHGSSKRGRMVQTGQFVEGTAVRSRSKKRIVGASGLKGVSRETLHDNRSIRLARGGEMVEAVMHAAADAGLTVAKDGRIAGRISSELIARAKANTGLTSDTELLEFALANIAMEDKFAEAFHAVRGTIDADIDFGS